MDKIGKNIGWLAFAIILHGCLSAGQKPVVKVVLPEGYSQDVTVNP